MVVYPEQYLIMAQLDELRADQGLIRVSPHGNVVLISKISFGVCWWPTTGAHLRSHG